MRLLSVACFLAIGASGCSTTTHLAKVEDVNPKVEGAVATISLKSDGEREVRDIRMKADSTTFVDLSSMDTVRIPTNNLKSVSISHQVGGALEGLMWGALGGTGLALVSTIGMSGGEGAGMGPFVLGSIVLGGTAGIVLGAIKGHNYTFILPEDSTALPTRGSDNKENDSAHERPPSAP